MSKKTDVESVIQGIMEKEAAGYLKDVRGVVRKALEESTLSLIGIKPDYHRGHEIDHCNSRNSVLIDAFRSIAIDEAKGLAATYKPSKEDFAGFRAAFENEYKRQIRYAIESEAKSKAQIDAKELVSKIKLDAAKCILGDKV